MLQLRSHPIPAVPPTVVEVLSDDERDALRAEIKGLLRAQDAVMVAHYYVRPRPAGPGEDTGGMVSDSLEMARFGRDHPAKTLVVAGVRFMGETAKILSPEKRVLMPDLEADLLARPRLPGRRLRGLLRRASRPHRGRLRQHQRGGEGARRLAGDVVVRARESCAPAQGAGPEDPVGARPAPGRLRPARRPAPTC